MRLWNGAHRSVPAIEACSDLSTPRITRICAKNRIICAECRSRMWRDPMDRRSSAFTAAVSLSLSERSTSRAWAELAMDWAWAEACRASVPLNWFSESISEEICWVRPAYAWMIAWKFPSSVLRFCPWPPKPFAPSLTSVEISPAAMGARTVVPDRTRSSRSGRVSVLVIVAPS